MGLISSASNDFLQLSKSHLESIFCTVKLHLERKYAVVAGLECPLLFSGYPLKIGWETIGFAATVLVNIPRKPHAKIGYIDQNR
jgi:hypothetical protein